MNRTKIEHFEVNLSAEIPNFIPREDLDDFVVKDRVLSSRYPRISPKDFYRYIFPFGSFERLGHQEDKKGNGVAISIDETSKKATKTIITDGLEQLDSLLEEPFVICSPISYYGRSRRADHALWMHALTLDIDYVGEGHLKNMLNWFEELNLMPRPTFIVNSGHGVHLYYVFEQPIAMYRNNQAELLKLKKYLVDCIWTKYTSTKPERKEALGVVQGFRMVGSRTKMGAYRLSAYKTGERVTVEYLNGYTHGNAVAKINQPAALKLEAAKQRFPEWYESRIVRGEMPGRWHIKRDLYDWWKQQIESKTTIGHRYFCMLCLAVYARKCDIAENELRADAAVFQAQFNDMGKDTDEPFTWEETEKALEAYNECYVTFPRDTIARLTAIQMQANKRNFQKQEFHLEEARAIRDIRQKRQGKNWWDGGNRLGAPKKKDLILEYKAKHPDANHSEIARALGVSRPTVIKWLKEQ
ncbi:hypothetical protein [Adlercreutzia agrestimuris]|uniref:hypothetical protein n=1 Tax=Adlercreutzia agrestimuris TaxID=2941324 RepID=UPI00203D4AFD|nr:hypothetical protein [Adlercreutzia agrestimuris]